MADCYDMFIFISIGESLAKTSHRQSAPHLEKLSQAPSAEKLNELRWVLETSFPGLCS